MMGTAATVAAMAVAGGVGAAARFVLDGWISSRLRTVIPVGTILINVSGSLALGIVAGLVAGGQLPAQALTIVGVGFLGGFTTFSTASIETVRLIQAGRPIVATANALGTAALALTAAAIGLLIGQW